ncbi:MAG: hypothetical protein ACR2OI_00070 [Acidimicrobiia bacterium]
MTEGRTADDERQLQRFWMVLGLAGLAAGVAATAGLALWIADPEAGTSPEEVLGVVAAASGLLAGILFGVAAIYAQVKNLWRFAPNWFRYAAWVVLIVLAIVAIVSSVLRDS